MSFDGVYDSKIWLKSYTPSVPASVGDLPFGTLAELVTKTATRYGDKVAYTTCLENGLSGGLTFREVDELSDSFASYLRNELSLAKGDRVAVQLPNCNAYPVCAFGVFKAGCVLVNVNPLYTEREMEHQLNDSGAKVLVIIDLFADKLPLVVPKTQIKHVLTVSVADFFPLVSKLVIKSVLKLKKKVPENKVPHRRLTEALNIGAHRKNRENSLTRDFSDIDPDDIAALQYTGGTTGVAKGAMLTHRNLIANLAQIVNFARTQLVPGGEVIISALPLYHIFAFTVNNLSFFYAGAHNILIPSPRPITNLKKPFEKFPPTWLTGVNTLFNALLNESWFASRPPKIKMSVGGGAALHRAVVERWEKVVKSPLLEGYGMTESSPVLTFNPIGGKSKIGSIGIPFPDTSVRIVDDSGNSVALGEPGELIAKGPQVMRGYWQRPEDSANTLKDGWLYTGDVACMDEDGYFKIVDRKKDMILVSGFNVYPNEVEDCIAKHPAVSEVAVIGVPDEQCGEAVSAYIVPKDDSLTAEVIRKHCKEMLAGYKVPKLVTFRKDLPKTPIGKILRKELRAEVLGSQKTK